MPRIVTSVYRTRGLPCPFINARTIHVIMRGVVDLHRARAQEDAFEKSCNRKGHTHRWQSLYFALNEDVDSWLGGDTMHLWSRAIERA